MPSSRKKETNPDGCPQPDDHSKVVVGDQGLQFVRNDSIGTEPRGWAVFAQKNLP